MTPTKADEIADALKFLRDRIIGYQLSNNAMRVINEEIKKYDSEYEPVLRNRGRAGYVEKLQAELSHERQKTAGLIEALKFMIISDEKRYELISNLPDAGQAVVLQVSAIATEALNAYANQSGDEK